MSIFRKRVFTPALLGPRIGLAIGHLPILIRGLLRPKTSRALREQVMLAVTSVNDCRYCDWVHTGLALQESVNLEELQLLLGGNHPGRISDGDTVAILFAQHYADKTGNVDPAWYKRLREHFSPAQIRELMAYIHAIYFANLSGNTFDALLARFKGYRVEGSHLWIELLCAPATAPILLSIRWKARHDRRFARLHASA